MEAEVIARLEQLARDTQTLQDMLTLPILRRHAAQIQKAIAATVAIVRARQDFPKEW